MITIGNDYNSISKIHFNFCYGRFYVEKKILLSRTLECLTRRGQWCPFWTNELVSSSEKIESKFEK